jgi:RNA polymerase sigma-70 factor (ECF subfamily)
LATNHENSKPVSFPPRGETDDSSFHEALRRRDPDAFSRLVEDYGARLQGLARQFASDRDAADDLLQEIFIEIYRSLPQFRGDSALYTFLFRIALNRSARARTRARAREARLPILPAGSERDRYESTPAGAPGPAAAAERKEANSMAEAALAGLDPSHRAALYLRAVEGLSYPEIAGILSCPTGTVKSRIFFARLRVSEALGLAGEGETRHGEGAARREDGENVDE